MSQKYLGCPNFTSRCPKMGPDVPIKGHIVPVLGQFHGPSHRMERLPSECMVTQWRAEESNKEHNAHVHTRGIGHAPIDHMTGHISSFHRVSFGAQLYKPPNSPALPYFLLGAGPRRGRPPSPTIWCILEASFISVSSGAKGSPKLSCPTCWLSPHPSALSLWKTSHTVHPVLGHCPIMSSNDISFGAQLALTPKLSRMLLAKS